MKIILLFAALILGFIAVTTAISRPEIIKMKYSEIRAPIDNYFAEKNSRIWREAKEAEQAVWMLKQRLPKDCGMPKTALREIECNNMKQLQLQTFDQIWSGKISSGWKPEGIGN